jgi:apolipoprotein D and lipocalin family protein
LLLASCTSINFKTVDNFDASKYLGDWYEIARLENRFEKGCQQNKANYSIDKDGRFIVGKLKTAKAIGRMVGSPNQGKLKIAFFRPFYGDYNILKLDPTSYSLVVGSNYKYLWILSRNKTLDKKIQNDLISEAKKLGFATEKLIYVKH